MGMQWQKGEGSGSGGFAYRVAIAMGMVCLAVAGLWLIYRGVDVLLTLFAGIVMAVLLYTLSEPLTRWIRAPLWAAVLIVTLAILGALTAGSILLAPSVSNQFDQLTEELPRAIDRVRGNLERYKWTDWVIKQGGDATKGQNVVRQATRVFSITMTAAAAIAIVAFLALYMAAGPRTYVEGTVRLFAVSYRPRAREVMAELYRTLRTWLLTKLVSMAFVGLCLGIGLWALKVPLALALGIVAGLLEFIPTIGPLLSAAPAILIAFVRSPTTALYVAILYFAVQWIQNHVTNPLLQQKTLQLPPAVSLLMVALLGALFGFGGLLLSGPLSVVVLVLVKRVYVEDVLERGRKRIAARRFPHEQSAR
jgi:predicted PurR-regulated permease PerM